jgi:hypothetical protein
MDRSWAIPKVHVEDSKQKVESKVKHMGPYNYALLGFTAFAIRLQDNCHFGLIKHSGLIEDI